MDPSNIISVMRADKIPAGESGLWAIAKASSWTFLVRHTDATLHQARGITVMDDSRKELSRHLNFCLRSFGTVLIGGLGLGCVARGVLANPLVTRADIIEIDKSVIKLVGPYMPQDPRLNIIHADIFEHIKSNFAYDCAWYDLWTEDDSLQVKHIELIAKMRKHIPFQGAWALPRLVKKIAKRQLGLA